MGKQLPLVRKYESELEEHQPRSFWGGMLRVLDYHHWQYVKKLLHHKKHHPRGRRVRCCAAPKTISFTNDAGRAPEYVDESEHLLGQHDHGNAVVDNCISKKEIDRKHVRGFSTRKVKQDRQTESSNPNSTKVEDELFQRILHDPHFGIVKDLTSNHDGIGQPRFTKARSFPLPDSSRPRHHTISTLKHKQSEVWFFPGGDRLNTGTPNFPEDHETSLVRLNASLKREITGPSLHNRGWNHLIMSQFRGIKRRIKRALRESQKGSLPAEGMVDHEGSVDDAKGISNDRVEEGKLQRMVRLSSLNESLDKYARLFGDSFTEESSASKLNNSKSLKLTAEDKTSTSKTFRRRLSLPDHEALGSLFSDLSYDNLYSKELKSKSGLLHESLQASDTTLITEEADSSGGGVKDLDADGGTCDEISVEFSRREEEIAKPSKSTSEAELSSPVSILPSFLPHNTSNEPQALCPSNGVDSRPCDSSSDENVCSRTEAADVILKPRLETVKEDESDCNLVKDILRKAGFFENEFIEPWESMDLPLHPTIFDELEASKLHGLECSEVYCSHQLLFDLVNEALLDIHERHLTYFPRAFSSSQFTRPVTKGQHVFEEVWTRVKWCRGMGRAVDPTLDDIVSQDMAKGDRWMSLGPESECVALELEDMILDELVSELLHT